MLLLHRVCLSSGSTHVNMPTHFTVAAYAFISALTIGIPSALVHDCLLIMVTVFGLIALQVFIDPIRTWSCGVICTIDWPWPCRRSGS